MTTKDPLIGVYEEALRLAENAARQGQTVSKAERELEILFYGMMCFDPLADGSGYRVLFPNGLDLTELTDIPVHAAGVWVRGRGARATARWSGLAFRNDFFVNQKHQLTITGLAKTPLDTDEFEGRVTNLQTCDPNFTIREDPDAVIQMIVDRGTLSAHVVNGGGMIVVKWAVQVDAGVPVRFTFGNDFVEIPPTVTQVFLANVSASSDEETLRHFQLYRKLSTEPSKPLPFRGPERPNSRLTATLVLNEPTFGYLPGTIQAPRSKVVAAPKPGGFPSIVGAVPQSTSVAQTPNVVCSAVVSRPRAAATG